MKRIPLTQGKFAIVDDDDYESLSKFTWCYKADKCGYAIRGMWIYPKTKIIRMHRQIMNTPKGMQTDHINGDGLDNRQSNLRICTNQQNSMGHKKKIKNKTSKFRGVSWLKDRQKWRSVIMFNQKQTHLGHFHSEGDAAFAYNKKAKELFGKWAQLNTV